MPVPGNSSMFTTHFRFDKSQYAGFIEVFLRYRQNCIFFGYSLMKLVFFSSVHNVLITVKFHDYKFNWILIFSFKCADNLYFEDYAMVMNNDVSEPLYETFDFH